MGRGFEKKHLRKSKRQGRDTSGADLSHFDGGFQVPKGHKTGQSRKKPWEEARVRLALKKKKRPKTPKESAWHWPPDPTRGSKRRKRQNYPIHKRRVRKKIDESDCSKTLPSLGKEGPNESRRHFTVGSSKLQLRQLNRESRGEEVDGEAKKEKADCSQEWIRVG